MLKYLRTSLKTFLRNRGFAVVRSHVVPLPLDDQRRLVGEVDAPIVFDVGGNRGDSVKEYRKCFSRASIHCFEPLPEAFRHLQEENRNYPNVHLVRKAVADQRGTSTFFVNTIDVQSSLLEISEIGRRSYRAHKESVEVELTTIDDYCDQHSVDRIDLLKMDIQGGEALALKGASGMLDRHGIAVIYIEAWFMPHYTSSPTFCDITAQLKKHGYSLFGIYNLTRDSNGQIVKVDAIFISPQVQHRLDEDNPSWRSERLAQSTTV